MTMRDLVESICTEVKWRVRGTIFPRPQVEGKWYRTPSTLPRGEIDSTKFPNKDHEIFVLYPSLIYSLSIDLILMMDLVIQCPCSKLRTQEPDSDVLLFPAA